MLLLYYRDFAAHKRFEPRQNAADCQQTVIFDLKLHTFEMRTG